MDNENNEKGKVTGQNIKPEKEIKEEAKPEVKEEPKLEVIGKPAEETNVDKSDDVDKDKSKKDPEFLQPTKMNVAVYSSIFSVLSLLPNIPLNQSGKRVLKYALIQQIVKQYCSQISISPLVSPIIEGRVTKFLVEEMIVMPMERSQDFFVGKYDVGVVKYMIASSFIFNISIIVALHLYKSLPVVKVGEFEKSVTRVLSEADKDAKTKEVILLSALEKTKTIKDAVVKENVETLFRDLFAFSVDGKMLERYVMLHCLIITFFISKQASLTLV